MRTISSAHYTLGICAAAAMLASCGGGSTSSSYQLPGTSQSTRAQSVSSAAAVPDAACPGKQSFNYTGQSQKFIVPKCALTVYVDALGAAGAYCANGGEVNATIPVTPGETLVVKVGGQGSVASGGGLTGAAGAPKTRQHDGASGGGASDVRQGGNGLAQRVVVAGGGGSSSGGGGGGLCGSGGGIPDGGNGGNPECSGGSPNPGGGGTQSSGGIGGKRTNGGSLGNGGNGVGHCLYFSVTFGFLYHWSGGGGGGYYGGGGGTNGGASGGGSGYAEPTASNVSSQNGANGGNGSVVICWGYGNGECGSRRAVSGYHNGLGHWKH
jgi:hypothetical protein